MSTGLKELEARAMRLPPEDRERLARRLFKSLSDDTSDPEWEKEIAQRIQQIKNGTAEFRSIEEVFAEVAERTT
ncbi:MAG: addiction module protein [Verrucomicrobiota bacterium]